MKQTSAPPALFFISSKHLKKGLVDPYGRTIQYLRMAVTGRCNLRCCYCMPEEGIPNISHSDILRFEELERLVRLFASLGVKKSALPAESLLPGKALSPLFAVFKRSKGLSLSISPPMVWLRHSILPH